MFDEVDLGGLFLNNRLYKISVHPHLEYAQAVWSLASQKLIDMLENVQIRAKKMVDGLSATRLASTCVPGIYSGKFLPNEKALTESSIFSRLRIINYFTKGNCRSFFLPGTHLVHFFRMMEWFLHPSFFQKKIAPLKKMCWIFSDHKITMGI